MVARLLHWPIWPIKLCQNQFSGKVNAFGDSLRSDLCQILGFHGTCVMSFFLQVANHAVNTRQLCSV